MTRPILTGTIGFAPTAVEKVERLLEVLSALHEDPVMRGMFVLHGGTALNVFYDHAPRLSVDIDLMFVGAVELEAMRAERPLVDRRFREVIGALGYVVQATNDEHSGQTYRLKYPSDYLKIDISYLARVALLEPDVRTCDFSDPRTSFPVMQHAELAAGKVKAMMERMAARDVYDLHRLAGTHPHMFDDVLARALTVRAVCASDLFPFVIDPVQALERFRNLSPEFSEPLLAVLRAEDVVAYDEMLDGVAAWLAPFGVLNGAEAEFVERLRGRAEYRPDILFADWPDVAARAAVDPVMAWKVTNLRRLLNST